MKTERIKYSPEDANALRDVRNWWKADAAARPCFWVELALVGISSDIVIADDDVPLDYGDIGLRTIRNQPHTITGVRYVLFVQESVDYRSVSVLGIMPMALFVDVLTGHAGSTSRITPRLLSRYSWQYPNGLEPSDGGGVDISASSSAAAQKEIAIMLAASVVNFGVFSEAQMKNGAAVVWPDARELEQLVGLLTYADLSNFESSEDALFEKIAAMCDEQAKNVVANTDGEAFQKLPFFMMLFNNGLSLIASIIASQFVSDDATSPMFAGNATLFFANAIARLVEVAFSKIVEWGVDSVVEVLRNTSIDRCYEIVILKNPLTYKARLFGEMANLFFGACEKELRPPWPNKEIRRRIREDFRVCSRDQLEPYRYMFLCPFSYGHWLLSDDTDIAVPTNAIALRWCGKPMVLITDYRALVDVMVYRTYARVRTVLNNMARVLMNPCAMSLDTYRKVKMLRYYVQSNGGVTSRDRIAVHLQRNGARTAGDENGSVHRRTPTPFPSTRELNGRAHDLFEFSMQRWPNCMVELCRKALIGGTHWVHAERMRITAFLFTIGWSEQQAMQFWYHIFRRTKAFGGRAIAFDTFQHGAYGKILHSDFNKFSTSQSSAACSCKTLQGGGLCPMKRNAASTDANGVIGDIEDLGTPGARCMREFRQRFALEPPADGEEIVHPAIYARRSAATLAMAETITVQGAQDEDVL